MKKAYEAYGRDGLLPRVRRKPKMPNRTPQRIEQEILLVTCKKPMLSYIRLAGEMKIEGTNVTPAMIRYVWQRHGLSTQSARRAWVKLLDGRSRLNTTKDLPIELFDKPLQGESNHVSLLR
jgi:hypothetical protein